MAERLEPRQIYGRRQGRKLRPQRRALLADLLPRLSVSLPEPPEELDPTGLFERAVSDVWLEIGFGAGEHLALQAGQHADIGLLGADYFVNGVAGLLRLVEQERLANVRLYQGDGRDLLAALPPRTLGRVFILFPDPWRKTRHHKRRVVSKETLDQLANAMKDGAELRLATDHEGYLTWILELCCSHPDFQWAARRASDWRTRPSDWPATRYERKAIAAGRSATYLRFLRRVRRRK